MIELTELLTVGGASAIILVLIQVIRPALGFPDVTWQRFGALIAILLGIFVTTVANLALGTPVNFLEAGLTGLLAGAASSGLYQAGTRTTEAVAARLANPPVSDYDPRDAS